MDTSLKKTPPAAGMSAARRRSEASEVLESHSAGAERQTRFSRRIGHEPLDESHARVGQTWLRVHRPSTDELGKEPDGPRGDPIVGLGGTHHYVRDGEQAAIRSL